MQHSTLLYVVLGLMITMTVSASDAEARRDQSRNQVRERSQDARIHEGASSGELNRNERRRARAGQRRIDRTQDRANADGVLTGKEKARLERMQNHESRKIYRMKHNDQKEKASSEAPDHGASATSEPANDSQ